MSRRILLLSFAVLAAAPALRADELVARAVAFRRGDSTRADAPPPLPPLNPDVFLLSPSGKWPLDIEEIRALFPRGDAPLSYQVAAIETWPVRADAPHVFNCAKDRPCLTASLIKGGTALDVLPGGSNTSMAVPALVGSTYVFGAKTDPRQIVAISFFTSSDSALADVPMRTGEGVTPPQVFTRVEPIYPEADRLKRLSGIAILEVLVMKDGTVGAATVIKHLSPGLDAAAIDAVRKWRFLPARVGEKPVNVYFMLTINFKLT